VRQEVRQSALRLMARLERRIMHEPNTGCHIWVGATNKKGYGLAYVKIDGKWCNRSVHKTVYEFERGPVPKGLEIDHLCRNTRCCNPAHLEAVSHRENVMRGAGPSSVRCKYAAITHCPAGHEYSPGNTNYFYSARGYRHRQCRICKHARNKMRDRRRRVPSPPSLTS